MPHFISLVIPVRDGGSAFLRCLDAIRDHGGPGVELLVVDDGSRDGSAAAAVEAGARLLRTPGAAGPGAARNIGAAAAGAPWLLFLDADCEVGETTLPRLRQALEREPELTAAFGSYDHDPPAPGLISQYKNLLHHWVHQRGAGDAETFWAGCGAVRRAVFEQVGGFDTRRYSRPSIEDVELGFRLRAAGHRIRLLPDVQVKHHKRWTLGSLLRTDVRDRALPWAELGLERGGLGRTLNVDWRGRACGAASLLLLVSLPAFALAPWLAATAAAASAAFLGGANLGFYRFLARRRGLLFALRAIPLHWLYFAYSTGAYVWAVIGHLGRRLRGSAPETGEGIEGSTTAGRARSEVSKPDAHRGVAR